MKLISLEDFKTELEKKLEISHPGNLQIEMGDKVFLYYAESHDNDYDENDNEFMSSIFISMRYYGEHHDVVVRKEDNEINVSYSEGELSSQLFDFIEDDLSDHILVLWTAIDNWTLIINRYQITGK